MNVNRVFLGGNITRELELEYTPSGREVVTFGIALNKKWRDRDSGEMKETVSFHDCRAWGKTAEVIVKHFTKGKPILIEGELTQERWEDKESGKKRSKTLVLVNHFHFVGDGGGGKRPAPEEPEDRRTYDSPREAHPSAKGGKSSGQECPRPSQEPMPTEEDDDIPF